MIFIVFESNLDKSGVEVIDCLAVFLKVLRNDLKKNRKGVKLGVDVKIDNYVHDGLGMREIKISYGVAISRQTIMVQLILIQKYPFQLTFKENHF